MFTGDGRQHGHGRRDQLGGHQAEEEAGLHLLVVNNNVYLYILVRKQLSFSDTQEVMFR